jgi:hypothetical protein
MYIPLQLKGPHVTDIWLKMAKQAGRLCPSVVFACVAVFVFSFGVCSHLTVLFLICFIQGGYVFFIRHDRCYDYIRLHHDYRRHIYHRHPDGQFRLLSPLL